MDNATHAFAGLLLADATLDWIERRTGKLADTRTRRAVAVLGVVAAELPDADLLYSGPVVGLGKLGYLLHHRGHTHTVVFAVLAAVVLWWCADWYRRRLPNKYSARAGMRERVPLLVLALAGTLSHLALDYTNSYGVHPLWPFNNQWMYGDAVFIVEPWLWVVAIPPLLFGPRRWWSRGLLVVLLSVIVLASWTLGEVVRPLAIAVIAFAALWMFTQYLLPSEYRVRSAVVVWCIVELLFIVSSSRARAVLDAPLFLDEQIVDVVLSPEAANPWCYSAIVVSNTTREYIVRTATVSPWTQSRTPSTDVPVLCRAGRGRSRLVGLPGATSVLADSTTTGTRATSANTHVVWDQEWRATRDELRTLAATRCEFAAALRFLRVPVWTTAADGVVHLSDVRFGIGDSGFSDITVGNAPCSLSANAWLPPWTPPRVGSLMLQ